MTLTTMSCCSLSMASEDKAFETEYTTAEQIIDTWLKNTHAAATQASPIDASTAIKHSLTHFHWYLAPRVQQIDAKAAKQLSDLLTQADVRFVWQTADAAAQLSLPRAMVKILDSSAAG